MKRNAEADIVKGICIILMLLGHCGFLYYNLIYLFHMPVFFILSGYFASEKQWKDKQSYLQLIKKRVKSLYVPLVACNIVFLLLHNIFIKCGIINGISEFQNEELKILSDNYYSVLDIVGKLIRIISFNWLCWSNFTDPTWFIWILFWVTLLYSLLQMCCKQIKEKNKIILLSIISVVLLILSYFWYNSGLKIVVMGVKYAEGIQILMSVFVLYHGGFLLKKTAFLTDIGKKVSFWCIFACSGVILYVLYKYGNGETLALNKNYIVNPVFYLISSFSGLFFCWGIAFIMRKLYIWKIFSFIGQNTMCILLLHLLSFKIVNLIQIFVYHYPMYYLAAFPFIPYNGYWWAAYTLCGVIVPIGIKLLGSFIKKKYSNMMANKSKC